VQVRDGMFKGRGKSNKQEPDMMIADAAAVEPAVLSPALVRSVRVGPLSQHGRGMPVRGALLKLPPVERERREIVDEEPERWDGMS
jgi:hypothetical protein